MILWWISCKHLNIGFWHYFMCIRLSRALFVGWTSFLVWAIISIWGFGEQLIKKNFENNSIHCGSFSLVYCLIYMIFLYNYDFICSCILNCQWFFWTKWRPSFPINKGLQYFKKKGGGGYSEVPYERMSCVCIKKRNLMPLIVVFTSILKFRVRWCYTLWVLYLFFAFSRIMADQFFYDLDLYLSTNWVLLFMIS